PREAGGSDFARSGQTEAPAARWALEQTRWERLRQHCRPDGSRKMVVLRVPGTVSARSAQPVIAQSKVTEARTGVTAAHPQSSGGAVLSGARSVLSLGSQRRISIGAMVFGPGSDVRPQ